MKALFVLIASMLAMGFVTAAAVQHSGTVSSGTSPTNIYEIRFNNQDIPIWTLGLEQDYTPEMGTIIELPESVIREHDLPGPWWRVFRREEIRDDDGILLSRKVRLEIQTIR